MINKILAGNWKMNLSLPEAIDLTDKITQWMESQSLNDTEVIICPPFPYIAVINERTQSSLLKLGAQNCHQEKKGAYTGEVSAEMIKSCGANYVIIGHSERRSYYNESESLLLQKTNSALAAGLTVIFCLGENLITREEARHQEVVQFQLEHSIFQLPDPDGLVIAYEPVWAIGTGKTASPEQVQEMHSFIRQRCIERWGRDGENIPLLYGGSVKPENAAQLFSLPDVQGGLIGGASLLFNDFTALIRCLIQPI